jgi:hypothetical protein
MGQQLDGQRCDQQGQMDEVNKIAEWEEEKG